MAGTIIIPADGSAAGGHPNGVRLPFIDPFGSNDGRYVASTSPTSLNSNRQGPTIAPSPTDYTSVLGDDVGGRYIKQTTNGADGQPVYFLGPGTNSGLLPDASPYYAACLSLGRVTDCVGGVGLCKTSAITAFYSTTADPNKRHVGLHWNEARFGDDNVRVIYSATDGGVGSQKTIDTGVSLSNLLYPNVVVLSAYYVDSTTARCSIHNWLTGAELYVSPDITSDIPPTGAEVSWTHVVRSNGSATAIDMYTYWVVLGCNPMGVGT